MDPRRRKLQEALAGMRGTFLLSAVQAPLTWHKCTAVQVYWRDHSANHPINTFPSPPGQWCGCSLCTDILPSTVWYQTPLPAGRKQCQPFLGCRGCVCRESRAEGQCWGQALLSCAASMLTQLETKACLCCIPQAKPVDVIPTSWSCHFVLPKEHKGDNCASFTCSSYNIFPGKGRFALWI